MSTPSPSARAYRRLGYLALFHAVAVFGLAFLLRPGETEVAWRLRLWVALVTLWFFWPVALVLHRGRSALRFAVFMLLAVVVLFPSLWFYNMLAPDAFGLPDGVHMNPISAWMYFSAYRAGRAEAKKDIAAGILAIEEFGFSAGTGGQILRERYQIEVRAIAGCGVDDGILGHAAGYNSVSEPEIHRRFGRDHIAAARDEGAKLWDEKLKREQQFSKDLARRLSSLPPDAKIMTESIWPYVDEQLLNDPAAEEELAPLVHAVERYLVEHVSKDAPPFKVYVSAKATPTSGPTFEILSINSPPTPIWENLHNNLQTIAAPCWSKGSLRVGLYCVSR